MADRHHRSGFTLIEMIIAVAAGSLIILVAMAGFNAAMRTTTAVRRIGIETELLSLGILVAFDELDYWDGFIGAQDLRACSEPIQPPGGDGSSWLGTPFTPFRSKGQGEPWPSAAQGYVRGWVEDERAWAIGAENEHSWWTASPVEDASADCRFGRYSILGACRKPVTTPQFMVDSSVQAGTNAYGAITLLSRDGQKGGKDIGHWGWLFDQTRMLGDALGWYGQIDYLPANAFTIVPWQFARQGLAATAANGFPMIWYQSTSRGSIRPYFVFMQHSNNVSPNLDFLTDLTCYTITPLSSNALTLHAGEAVDLKEGILHNRFQTVTNLVNTNGGNGFRDIQKDGTVVSAANDTQVMDRFQQRSSTARYLMGQRPQDWPNFEVQVGRYLTVCRFQNQARVGWFSAVSGEQADLRFSAMGTTLRGARRQRGLDR